MKDFTPLPNKYLDHLGKTRLSGEEHQLLDVILRKTWGWGKNDDRIALSQFVEATGGMKKQSVIRGLKKLEDKHIISVSKLANEKGNLYCPNKKVVEWKIVSKKAYVSKLANKSLAKVLPTINKIQKTKRDKSLLGRKPAKVRDPLVDFILEEFESRANCRPTDKKPRFTAQNLLSITRSLIKAVKPYFPPIRLSELNEKVILSAAFNWYFGLDMPGTTALSTVKRHIDARFYEATRKKYIPNYKLQQPKP